MAKSLTPRALRDTLRTPSRIAANSFAILRSLCAIASDDKTVDSAVELILRALEYRTSFGRNAPLLDELARTVGLYPYARPENLDTKSLMAYEYHRPLSMNDDTVLHRVQADVYRRLLAGENVVLSAPTSFGKSLLIDAMIATGKYNNIVIVVPTLALIDETRRRLARTFRDFKIITHNSQLPGDRNIYVLTQERAVAFDELPKVDFFVIDEFYKLGAEGDSTRQVSLNHAFYKLLKSGGQFYLLGPNIEGIADGIEEDLECVFVKTHYATVVSEETRVLGDRKGSLGRLISLARSLDEATLVYCSSPARANEIAAAFIEEEVTEYVSGLGSAAQWISEHFHPDWIFGLGLKHGIGIHHGRLPRALSQYVVRKFNEGHLRFLICTSTLIEGVNTRAKNVVVFDNKVAKRKFDYFTFNNIRGRSGRMFMHFIGHVYLFHEPPSKELPVVDFPVFTQGESVSTSLLIQLDDEDLSDVSRERVSGIVDQDVLSLGVIRANAGLDPAFQIELADEISNSPSRYSRILAWSGFPTYEELVQVCELIWRFFVRSGQRRSGISSGKQLAFKLSRLSRSSSTADLIAEEMKSGNHNGATDAVEAVLEFQRNWAGYEFPRLLMALSRIQEYVLGQHGLPAGNYEAYAGQVECLFRSKVILALDEYGVPMELAEQIAGDLATTDDLDVALANLKTLQLRRRFSPFELDVLKDVQGSL